MDKTFHSPARLDPQMRQAIALADAARIWFNGPGSVFIASLPPHQRLKASTERLAISARLMAAIAWLLHPRQGQRNAPPFNPPEDPPLRPGHPLENTPGGQIAMASRAFIQHLKDQP